MIAAVAFVLMTPLFQLLEIAMRFSVSFSLTAAALSLTVFGLAGCSSGSSTDAPPPMPAGADTCGVTPLQKHIGEPLDVTLMQFFESAVPSHRVRVLKPDTAMTDDMVPERANVKTDNNNIITAITCG
ncbi:MAG TPA: I78 family peptidase inhibitor [Dongiaceae bacterium]|nr:I78 family peptidase inhibitor [Dongiaceae bacterium]